MGPESRLGKIPMIGFLNWTWLGKIITNYEKAIRDLGNDEGNDKENVSSKY